MARYQRAALGMTAFAALAGACSSGGLGGASTSTSGGVTDPSTAAATGSSGSTGGGSGMGGATASASSATTSAVAVGVGGFGGAGGGDVCDPPADPSSFWAQMSDVFGSSGPTSMCKYRGDVVLAVNTAAV